MKNINRRFSFLLVALLALCGFAFQANAQNANEINDILNRAEAKLTDYQYNFNYDVNRGSITQDQERDASALLQKLRYAMDNFRQKLDDNNETPEDVKSVLSVANSLNMTLLRLKASAKTLVDWKAARANFDQLAAKYGVSTYWNDSAPRSSNTVGSYGRNNLTGTYQINNSRGDNLSEAIEEALNNGDAQDRDSARRELESKLESPQSLAIEIQGNQASLASALAPRISFPADGNIREQAMPDGSTVRLRATLRGQELTVAKLGDDEDYTVTFASIDNGKTLKVTRRLTVNYLNQTLFTESYYDKTDSIAQMDVYDNPNNYPNSTNSNSNSNSTAGNFPTSTSNVPTARTVGRGDYIVRNGEILTGTLNNMVSTKVSQNNDRFRLTVTAPSQYRGAIIEGYLTGIDRSNRNPIGKSRITFNFETIRLTNGQTYDFAGFLQAVTDTRGKNVKIDDEGTATKSSTKETIKRGGIGAGAGAIIGAIFGGAKGAVIGATIGAGAGAGTVAIQNSGDLELEAGSSLTVQSSSPVN